MSEENKKHNEENRFGDNLFGAIYSSIPYNVDDLVLSDEQREQIALSVIEDIPSITKAIHTKKPFFHLGQTKSLDPYKMAMDLKLVIDEIHKIDENLAKMVSTNFWLDIVNDDKVILVEKSYFLDNPIYNQSDEYRGQFATTFHKSLNYMDEPVEVAFLTPAQFIKLLNIELEYIMKNTTSTER